MVHIRLALPDRKAGGEEEFKKLSVPVCLSKYQVLREGFVEVCLDVEAITSYQDTTTDEYEGPATSIQLTSWKKRKMILQVNVRHVKRQR
jgi:hypothetical protein